MLMPPATLADFLNPWTCMNCRERQVNSWWAKECGRCGRDRHTGRTASEQRIIDGTAMLLKEASRLANVTPEQVEQAGGMSREELQRRWLIQIDYIASYASCLDGLGEIQHIPGGGIDGCRGSKEIRAIVEHLMGVSE